MDHKLRDYLTDKFSEFISEERKQNIEEVLSNRTSFLSVVIEDLVDPHNVNAIFRTGECMGVQDFHVIDNEQYFHVGKGVSKGSTKWIDIHRHDQDDFKNTGRCITSLKEKGYQLVVTSPAAAAVSVEDIDLSKPIALVLGNERDGVSEEMKTKADQLISIPTFGFTESFNVSVAGAILIHGLVNRIHKEVPRWHLDQERMTQFKYEWYKKSMARPDFYYKFFVKAFESEQNL